ncbi:MAG: DUF2996 domain-containing protein [Synechococcus sp.]|uniref:DUF2996 domain-containing protein n=1 Tax=Synechococcus sp. BMK-MC-1 TaxID=1442551 RepID=UPI001645739C|nr:DUF2996 domain-containing protein [Synechococcus sp. BMK-MC-1]QNI67468.1 NADH dehydrogenase subunit NdhV [Synechococcus sp. BMK-MC-1]
MSETPAKPKGETKPAGEGKAKPAAKPKLEDKPFASFMQEDFLPSLTKALDDRGQRAVSLSLIEGERPVVGGSCWMVKGELSGERRFWLCFESDAITSGKTIALAESGTEPSLLESFLIDEKRITLALLQSRLLQRLNGQKWLGGN